MDELSVQGMMSVGDFKQLEHDAKLAVIYAGQLTLIAYVADLERKASAMASPDAMAKMMEGFMGSMMKF